MKDLSELFVRDKINVPRSMFEMNKVLCHVSANVVVLLSVFAVDMCRGVIE